MPYDGPDGQPETPAPPSGREARFEALYSACYADVLGYLLRRADDPESAADLVAEVFMTVWNRLEDVPGGSGSRPWVFGVARKVLSNHRRGARRRTALAARLRSELSRVHVTRPETAEPALGEIGAAFRSLSETDREVLALTGWEGLSPSEVAIALGCTRGTARVRLHRARGRFARALRKAGVEVGDAAVPDRPLPRERSVTEGAS
ncbi:RNA polymerase sigma factor [Streptomonospora wellingtoniae]|uniref:Sigma-70 family RNA polymerase sigma factor n=1 Tax=Streptomonospora wellingtoniae TaxID=3075544 RepID=A0ABU2KZK1_9ACTN|nr:sigma-70 family RNA polymerase sigma factor [Streptomonospora sp. DSM 45055]MDT0304741.1 sigma-70 family RNA polymerase sigma factor [Streptomonospora sp. DSM 45055]